MRVRLLKNQGKSLVGSVLFLPIENLKEKSFENVIFILYFYFKFFKLILIKKISFLLMKKFLLICKKFKSTG